MEMECCPLKGIVHTKMNILCKYFTGYEMHGKWIYFDDNSQQNSKKIEAKLAREPAASRIDRMGEREERRR
jgi:hypothetical protein